MDLEGIVPSEASQRRTNPAEDHLYVESKTTANQRVKQQRSSLVENRPVLPAWRGKWGKATERWGEDYCRSSGVRSVGVSETVEL